MELRALTWNVYHGRDFPPDPALLTWRSRLLRISERNETHIQVNRDLFEEFAEILADAAWDVALLQEVPPRWRDPLAERCAAEAHRVLTSRNTLGPVRAFIARFNPDLIASNEGGSNLTLVRHRAGSITECRELELARGPRPERRVMAFTRIALAGGGELCVANVHLSTGRERRHLAEDELISSAEHAVAWARTTPLILGGDLNLRPAQTPAFDELGHHFALTGATGPNSLDHLLAHGLAVVEPATAWPPERREVAEDGLAIRLSDHAPVSARFELTARASPSEISSHRSRPRPGGSDGG
ncbi:MAG TPA: endonuclease/exonuclease/phosphatase family protein [Solirubrobacterales bacterium]|nr:endonuclease/exonuclease/phosphatase family protein [Solirubrobacterales bacterium]